MLNLRAVDLNLLTSFDALMIEENLSRAADRVGMSQPAMSAVLQRLRLSFKDELFVRNRQGMCPTPRALEVYPDIRQALNLIRGVLAPARAFAPRTAIRTFRLLGEQYFETVVMGYLLSAMKQAGPGLSLETLPLEGDVSARLRRLEADLLVDYVKLDSPDVRSECIGQERLVVIARRDHPRIQGSLSLDEYLAEEHVFLPLRSRESSQLEQALGGLALPRKCVAQVQNFSSMLPVVAATDYVAVLPARLFELYKPSFAVRSFELPLDLGDIPLWMTWPVSLEDDAGHIWLRNVLRNIISINS